MRDPLEQVQPVWFRSNCPYSPHRSPSGHISCLHNCSPSATLTPDISISSWHVIKQPNHSVPTISDSSVKEEEMYRLWLGGTQQFVFFSSLVIALIIWATGRNRVVCSKHPDYVGSARPSCIDKENVRAFLTVSFQ